MTIAAADPSSLQTDATQPAGQDAFVRAELIRRLFDGSAQSRYFSFVLWPVIAAIYWRQIDLMVLVGLSPAAPDRTDHSPVVLERDPAREDHHPTLLEMSMGAQRNVRLGDLAHRDRGLHARRDPFFLQKVLQRKTIHDRAEHAHIVRASAFHATLLKLRTAEEYERIFDVYVRPRIGNKSIYDLRRSDIVEMLDAVEDENGPVMADKVLARARKAFGWQAARDDAFVPPIVRGMARTSTAERARHRVLSDDELRAVCRAY